MPNRRTCLIVSRVKAGLSQRQLADKIGVSQQTIDKYEKGKMQPSSFKIINDLERTLKTKRECLFPDLFETAVPCCNKCAVGVNA